MLRMQVPFVSLLAVVTNGLLGVSGDPNCNVKATRPTLDIELPEQNGGTIAVLIDSWVSATCTAFVGEASTSSGLAWAFASGLELMWIWDGRNGTEEGSKQKQTGSSERLGFLDFKTDQNVTSNSCGNRLVHASLRVKMTPALDGARLVCARHVVAPDQAWTLVNGTIGPLRVSSPPFRLTYPPERPTLTSATTTDANNIDILTVTCSGQVGTDGTMVLLWMSRDEGAMWKINTTGGVDLFEGGSVAGVNVTAEVSDTNKGPYISSTLVVPDLGQDPDVTCFSHNPHVGNIRLGRAGRDEDDPTVPWFSREFFTNNHTSPRNGSFDAGHNDFLRMLGKKPEVEILTEEAERTTLEIVTAASIALVLFGTALGAVTYKGSSQDVLGAVEKKGTGVMEISVDDPSTVGFTKFSDVGYEEKMAGDMTHI